MMPKSRATVVRNAIDVVLRHLDDLPPSCQTSLLRSRLEECAAESERLNTSQPFGPAQNEIMRRVLALHVEVMDLERQTLQKTKAMVACP
jgi:hypothetical protein